MSDSPSSTRSAQPLPPPGEAGKVRAEPAAGSAQAPAVRDDQATVISHRAPLLPDGVSDSAVRILHGRILPGDRLGHFELVQYVGGGGMGRVFRALDTRLARTVALKILSPDQAADHETLLRFQNEAQSAARLDHDNIARVHYVGEDRGLHYIVFEFIEGVNVRELVEARGALPLPEAIGYTLQVADALAHASARNVVHRDIKPSNLLITPEGQVKLIDMGLARLREADKAAADLTASGVTLGTFDYISPEQARDPRNADVRSDIYSLGCTFFYMLTARPPFLGGTMLQKLLQHQGDQPPDVRQFRPDLPDDVTRVLRKMLAKDPGHRYRDAAALVADLLVLAKAAGLRRAAPGSRTWVVPTEPTVPVLVRHLPWLVPLVALVGIVFALDAFWSRSSRPDSPAPTANVEPDIPVVGNPAGPRDLEGAEVEIAASKQPIPAKEKPTVEPKQPPASGGAEPAAIAPKLPPGKPAEGPPADPDADSVPAPPIALSAKPASLDPYAPVRAYDANAPRIPLGGNPASAGPDSVAESLPAAKVASKQAGVLIVTPSAHGESEFTTLAAACAAVAEAKGDVIELCYNGRREEQPLRFSNARVTIRAGDGFQPVVVFRPKDPDPVRCPRNMLAVTTGRLSMINVALELIVPRDVPADSWSLFETHGNQSVRLEKCSLTISNASDQLGAYHQEVAFFRVKSATDADPESEDDTVGPAPTEAAVIDLADCVARGEAVLLRSEDLQPARLTWDNGLLVTTERMLSAIGGSRAPSSGEMLRLVLRHVTAIVRGGLARLASSQINPHQLVAQIDCSDTIISASPGSALIEHVGDDELDEIRQRLAWNGDRNVYEGLDAFWAIRRLDAALSPDAMGLEGWKAFWTAEHENLPKAGKVGWKKPPDPARPLHGHTVSDYALSELESNPAVGTASDGRDAGCLPERLPAIPSDPAPAKL